MFVMFCDEFLMPSGKQEIYIVILLDRKKRNQTSQYVTE